MKKILGSNLAKMVALLLVAVSTVWLAYGTIGMVLFAEMNTEGVPSSVGQMRDYCQENLAENYGAMLLNEAIWSGLKDYEVTDLSMFSKLEGGSLDYTVFETRVFMENGEVKTESFAVYGDENEVNSANAEYQISLATDGCGVWYQRNNNLFMGFSQPSVWRSQTDYRLTEDTENGQNQLDLEVTHVGNEINVMFDMSELSFVSADELKGHKKKQEMVIGNDNQLQEQTDNDSYVDTDVSVWNNPNDVIINMDDRMEEDAYFEEDEDYEQIDRENEADEDDIRIDEVSGNYQNEWEEIQEVDQIVMYTIYMRLGSGYVCNRVQYFDNGMLDQLTMTNDLVTYLATYRKIYTPITAISLLVLLLSAIFLCIAAGHRKDTNEIDLRMVDRMPYEIFTIIAVTGVSLGVAGLYGCIAGMYYSVFSFRDCVILAVVCIALSALLVAEFCMSTAVRLKTKTFWKYTICNAVIRLIQKPLKALKTSVRSLKRELEDLKKTNHGLYMTVIIVLLILAFVQLFVIAALDGETDIEIICFLMYKVMETAFIFWMIEQMNRIKQGGARVAAGDYSQPIRTNTMLPEFKAHAENINHVSDGIAEAVQEQMKSEHLKTELITNVTHDIKTPLTSIINYVDLIKKEEITNPTIAEYVEVLDRQSGRLKKLIEDLLEASKASTGNLKVNMETCDAKVLLSQVLGEYQEKMAQKQLDIIVDTPEKNVYIMADGRHLWRVLDNVMSNIYKYAMEGTRVYVTVEQDAETARYIFKNVSKNQLNISSDELLERFVRGDDSRNAQTEGHGLGLSIAQSLTKLMNGKLELEIDGDLFKVTITMSKR